jgi:hypothetical protein
MRQGNQKEQHGIFQTSRYTRLQSLRLVLISSALLGGCVSSMPGSGRTTHHLVIGLGVCSVNSGPNEAAIVTDVQALGLSISDRPGLKFALGYSSSTVATVSSGAKDVRMEISKRPGGPLIVEGKRAVLEQITVTGDDNGYETE